MQPRLITCCLALALAACTGRGPLRQPPDPVPAPPPQARIGREPKRAALTRSEVDAAAVPYYGIRASDGAKLEDFAVLDALSRADAICLAAVSSSRQERWLEIQVLQGLLARAPTNGREVVLGIPAFDAANTEPPDDPDLSPLLATAHEKQSAVVALGPPAEVLRQVSQSGLESLSEADRKHLPPIALDDAAHRALFDGASTHAYAAAVLTEEFAASTAGTFLSARQPARQMLVIAAARQCRAPALPARLRRAAHCRVVTVLPVIADRGVDLRQALEQYDFAIVLGKDND